MVSQDQQDSVEQPEPGTSDAQNDPSLAANEGEAASPAKKRVKRIVKVNVAEITPRSSIWPLALALALAILLVGLLLHPVIAAIGAILSICAAIGWITERR